MSNLHIMNDEKVVTRAICAFEEVYPQRDKFVILCPRNKCRYVKLDMPNVYYVSYNTTEFWDVIGDINYYKYIIVHYLSISAAKFISEISHPGIVWVIWGADLYNNIVKRLGYKLYDEPLSEFYYTITSNPVRTIKDRVNLFVNRISINKALSKISYTACFPDQDAQLLQCYYPKLQIKCKQYFYYPIDEIVGNLKINQNLGDNIIIGNSASFTNNHASVFKELSKCKLIDRRVITPISYGSGKDYVLRLGQKYCPNNFHPITGFLPIEEYNKILTSARTFIYGHYRQEAFGNILTALYIGGTVFLYERNPLYSPLKDLGFVIFPIEKIQELLDYHMCADEKKKNYSLCCKLFSKKRLLNCILTEFS